WVINLKTGEKKPIADFCHQPVIALAGIGYPPRFFMMLQDLGIQLKESYGFADHQPYALNIIEPLQKDGLPLLMTEKDAVKCRSFAQPNWWYVPVSAKFSA
ncbi:tetraacyldisaccharide 4'-kinase, partial [Glaesserella parasuis]|nr:tetraacyldisaccharide 4'-kinase [Glaesserella parasuis]